jgi:hypothetical protein
MRSTPAWFRKARGRARRWFRRHRALAGYLFLLALVLLALFRIEGQAEANCRSIETLKTIDRRDHTRRLAETLRYRDEHPQGTKDIPRELLDRSIANTRKTLDDLEAREC